MKSKTLALVFASAGLLTLSGCVANQSRSAVEYDANAAAQVQTLTFARIIDLRPVVINSSGGAAQYAALALGGLVGGTVGSRAGKSGSTVSTLGTAIGAAGGALGGEVLAKTMSKTDGVEVTIRMEDGRTVALVQEAEATMPLKIGQCVKVTYSSQQRVSPAPANGCK